MSGHTTHDHDHDHDAEAPAAPLDLGAIRRRLATVQGPEYWRSLEELSESEGFQEMLHREFPRQASEWTDPVGRRDFLKLMSASLALAGLGSCTRQPTETVVPYVRAPEEVVAGKALFFATTMPGPCGAIGLLVESHEGRPTKVEGNPQHPASLGATDAFAQASILSLYDPDRSQVVLKTRRISSWGAFLTGVREALDAQAVTKGAGLRILTGTVTSPTLAEQLRSLLKTFPGARWHQYEPANADGALAGARLAFSDPVATQYRFAEADVVLSLDADIFCSGPAGVRYAREFAARRRLVDGQKAMNRLYCVESTPSPTGSVADHRLPLRASEVAMMARAIARELGVAAAADGASAGPHTAWVSAVAADLKAHAGRSVVVAGERQPASVHALAHAMNAALGNAGKTVVYTDPIAAAPVDHLASLRELIADMQGGQVEMLVILGGDPVYTAPADVAFADAMNKVKLRIQLAPSVNATTDLCHWHIPESHYLESWGDARAFDGTASIIQPLIAPLYISKSAHEILGVLAGKPDASGYELLREYWKSQHPDGFELFWRTALHDGLVAGTAFPPRQVTLRELPAGEGTTTAPAQGEGLEIVFAPDPTIWDGRFINNGWLQELPKPLTKLTWDNAALVSPATAERLGVSNEQVVELKYQGRSVQAPVWILPGHADDAITVHLGYGQSVTGRVGAGTGFNAGALRTADAMWFGRGLELRKTGEKHRLACTQQHHTLAGRHIVRSATLDEFIKTPDFVKHQGEQVDPSTSLYPEFPYDGYAWGMAINQNACIGCNACVVACQAENNIPVVGKPQVLVGREMHWLRIDRYYKGDLENPEAYHQPMLCQHCEKAPCEPVCPVAATVHSPEGLNEMVYNRCVGTRYCSNNCPYKVRRFNFLLYSDFQTESLKPMRNPDVTVRSRGVMEKCTFCVQRISRARIESEKQDRPIQDGEIVTACEGACPTRAIVFGNINDPNSAVSKLKREPLNYGVLAELNTRPRTTYLARVWNPNPALAKGEPGGNGEKTESHG